MDDVTRVILKCFCDQFAEQVDMVAVEFGVHLVSDDRTTATSRAVSMDTQRMTSMARRWLNDALLGSDGGNDQAPGRFGRFEPSDLMDIPIDCLVRGISRVRRRLIGLARGASGESSSVAETVDAVERAIDLGFTAMLEAHRQILLDRLVANERLATIGQLVASIGHELRNPLSTIETSAYLLTQRLTNLAPCEHIATKHIDKIRHQVRVATKIVTDLLELAKNRPPRRSQFDLGPLLETAIAYVRCPDDVSIKLDVPEKLTVWADADQLRIILVNLLTNALDAVATGGTIAVVAAEYEGGMCLRLSDDGPGIGPAAEERIFEALYTTKPNGNGLGLPLCRRIAVAHGGELALQPSERGATFRLWLPGSTPTLFEGG